jgi:hypothetical protein
VGVECTWKRGRSGSQRSLAILRAPLRQIQGLDTIDQIGLGRSGSDCGELCGVRGPDRVSRRLKAPRLPDIVGISSALGV